MTNNSEQARHELIAIDSLLKDAAFSETMAQTLDAAYYEGMGKTPPPFLGPEEEKATVNKSVKEEKIAANLAGFYALECAVNYLVMRRGQPPSAILKSLLNDSLAEEDKTLLACFANATWKAGQPFRSMERITRETFTPFFFLSQTDREKDLVQVQAAARLVLGKLGEGEKEEAAPSV